jgi:beta-N-acetylhexosaminidase
MNAAKSGRLRTPLVLSYKGLTPDAELMEWVHAGLVAGIVLFRDNCTDETALSAAVSSLRRQSPHDLYIMIDEEGGRVRRLLDAPGSMSDLRSYEGGSVTGVAKAYCAVAQRLKSLGIDTLLAPVVDIGDDGAEWLNSRTISHDPDRVAEMAKAVIPAIQVEGIHACAKHFPGTGRVTLDPHHGPVVCHINPGEWERQERIPFDAAIAANVDMVLVGHQIMEGFGETLPACLTSAIPKFLLRRHLGYQGLILTDDLGMGAIARMFPIEEASERALESGCDLILICNDRDAQRGAVTHWATRKATS